MPMPSFEIIFWKRVLRKYVHTYMYICEKLFSKTQSITLELALRAHFFLELRLSHFGKELFIIKIGRWALYRFSHPNWCRKELECTASKGGQREYRAWYRAWYPRASKGNIIRSIPGTCDIEPASQSEKECLCGYVNFKILVIITSKEWNVDTV